MLHLCMQKQKVNLVADFCNDPKTIDAVIRNLEIIGEAARRLPEEIRIKYPDVEWHKDYQFKKCFDS